MKLRLSVSLALIVQIAVAQPKESDALNISKGYRIVERKAGRSVVYGVVDSNGKEVLPVKYPYVDFHAVPGYIVAGVLKETLVSAMERANQSLRTSVGGGTGMEYDGYRYWTEIKEFNLRLGLLNSSGDKILNFQFRSILPLGKYFRVLDKGGNEGLYSATGDVVVPSRYLNVFRKFNFIIVVDKHGQDYTYSLYNMDMVRVLNEDYDFINVISPRLVILQKNKTTTLSTLDGKDLVKGEFDEIQYLDSGYLAVRRDTAWAIMDTLQHKYTPFKFEQVLVRQNGRWFAEVDGKWGRIDTKGNFTSALAHNRFDTRESEIIPFTYRNKHGYLNSKDQWVLDQKYSATFEFEQGLAWVRIGKDYGVIDTQGHWIVPPENYSYGAIAENRIIAQKKYFPLTKTVYDNKGNEIAKLSFAYNLSAYNNGFAAFSGKSVRWGFVDLSGEIVIKPRFIFEPHFDDQGRSIVTEGPSRNEFTYGLIDTGGNNVVQGLSRIFEFGKFYVTITPKGEKRVIDKAGIEKFMLPYDSVGRFDDSHLIVKSGINLGLVSMDGQLALKPEYKEIRKANPTLDWIWVRRADLFSLYSIQEGKELLPANFEDVKQFDDKSLAFVKIETWGAINGKFERVIPFRYEDVLDQNWLFNTKAVKFNNQWGLINEQGQVVLPFQYEIIRKNVYGRPVYEISDHGLSSCLDYRLVEFGRGQLYFSGY